MNETNPRLSTAFAIAAPDLATRLARVELIDVRPWRERYESGIGFVPGSVCVPTWSDLVGVVGRPGRRSLAVLICTSGHRAEVQARRLVEAHSVGAVAWLDGGVLGWCTSELPTAGHDSRSLPAGEAPLASLSELPRRLLACFVAQLVETEFTQGRDADLDFEGMLQACVEAECPGARDPHALGLDEWYRVVERAAAMSVQIGTPPGAVARNVDHFLALMDDYAARNAVPLPWAA